MNYKTLTGLQNLFKSVVRPKSSGDFFAWLGNAQGTVVADDNNGVYIMDWNGNVRVVMNNKVPPYPFRPVRVGYVSESNKTLEVKEFVDAYPTHRPPHVPNHAGNHEWGGVDTMFIRGEQILPGVAIPDDDDPLVLHVAGFVYYLNGWHIIDSFTLDVTSYIPSSGAKFLLLEADDAGAITVQSGTAVDIREELVMEDIPSPTLGTVPLVAVMVYAGQVQIWKTLSKQDVVDLRWSRYATGLDTSITAPLYAGRHVAAVDPTATDDDTAGFLQLHLWLNSTSGDRFICTDNSTGAAVWAPLAGGGGGGVATVTGDLVDNTDPANPVVDLPAPTATDMGGVKRNAGSAGQFVNGISATGDLEYDTPAGGGSSDGWSPEANTWTHKNRTQAYTNDPAAGNSITLNMTNTADFVVGSDVTVSSSAGSENTHVTAVVANTSITVNQLLLNHTTSSPLVTLLDVFTVNADVTSFLKKDTRLKYTQTTVKYGTVYSSTHSGGTTTVVMIHNTDYALTSGAISATYYSNLPFPDGWPVWFNYDPEPIGWSTVPTTNVVYKYKTLMTLMDILIQQPGGSDSTVSNSTATSFSTPCLIINAGGTVNIQTVNNNAILTAAARTRTGVSGAGNKKIDCYTDMSSGAWTASNTKKVVCFLQGVDF